MMPIHNLMHLVDAQIFKVEEGVWVVGRVYERGEEVGG